MGCVYFIRATNGAVKIGSSSRSGLTRLAACQTGSPLPLELVCELPFEKYRSMEIIFHAAFSQYHSHGEWFMLPEGALNHISETPSEQFLKILKEHGDLYHIRKHFLRGQCPAPSVPAPLPESAVSGWNGYLTLFEVAQALSVSEYTVQQLVDKYGLMACIKDGQRAVKEEDLEGWIERNRSR